MRVERTAGLDWRYTVMRSLCSCFALPVFLSFLFCFFSGLLVCVLVFRFCLVLARAYSEAELGILLPLLFPKTPSTRRKILGEAFCRNNCSWLMGVKTWYVAGACFHLCCVFWSLVVTNLALFMINLCVGGKQARDFMRPFSASVLCPFRRALHETAHTYVVVVVSPFS